MTAASVDGAFLDHVVRYLAYLSRRPAPGVPMPHEELVRMIEVNVTEGLGTAWVRKFRHAQWHMPTGDEAISTTDGRMMLHEWLHVTPGYLKTDVDHHTDHFSPSCRDIAWDLAGCLVEWRLDRPMQNYLIGQYRFVAGDSTLPQRLPFYSIAYLAHRLGYATLATQTLGPDCPDGRRFKALTARYATLLQQELSQF